MLILPFLSSTESVTLMTGSPFRLLLHDTSSVSVWSVKVGAHGVVYLVTHGFAVVCLFDRHTNKSSVLVEIRDGAHFVRGDIFRIFVGKVKLTNYSRREKIHTTNLYISI